MTDLATPTARGAYGVKLVRGPLLDLPPHPDHVDDVAQLEVLTGRLLAEDPNLLLAADLFSGAGGLGLGLRAAGIETVFAVDHYTEAIQTHSHHFPGMSVDWDLSDPGAVERTAEVVRRCAIDVVAGGPPCQPFSKAGRSGIRYRVHHGLRDPHDVRRDLWRSFVEVVRLSLPRAVVMENVPDMALDTEMFILRSITHELESLGYSVEERVVETWRYGVPQFRQRLILVALRDHVAFTWPAETPEKVTVWNAIGDLPPVEGGWRPASGAAGWADYAGPETTFQRQMRRGVPAGQSDRLYDHITRPVRPDDARAFDLMSPDTKYSDLPEDVKRYRDDIFDDKYKRLDENDLSRTITAHIAKDGYWYIHPRQGRTLTVREAARLQTFPDQWRFAGTPSAAFRQIGNAVPPALGERLGEAVRAGLEVGSREASTTQEVAAVLAAWFGRGELRLPWLAATTRWQVIEASFLLEKATSEQVRAVWPLLRSWDSPDSTVAAAVLLRQIGSMTGRSGPTEKLLAVAGELCGSEGVLDDDDAVRQVPGVPRRAADMAVLAVPAGGAGEREEPVLAGQGVVRVATRFHFGAGSRRNALTEGRLAVARMIGGGPDSREAQLGLIELAATLCRPVDPLCAQCPLASTCRAARTPDDLINS